MKNRVVLLYTAREREEEEEREREKERERERERERECVCVCPKLCRLMTKLTLFCINDKNNEHTEDCHIF